MAELLDVVGPWACLAVIVGIPAGLAWWLSDGFTDVEFASGATEVRIGFNPYTEEVGRITVSSDTGIPRAYLQ